MVSLACIALHPQKRAGASSPRCGERRTRRVRVLAERKAFHRGGRRERGGRQGEFSFEDKKTFTTEITENTERDAAKRVLRIDRRCAPCPTTPCPTPFPLCVLRDLRGELPLVSLRALGVLRGELSFLQAQAPPHGTRTPRHAVNPTGATAVSPPLSPHDHTPQHAPKRARNPRPRQAQIPSPKIQENICKSGLSRALNRKKTVAVSTIIPIAPGGSFSTLGRVHNAPFPARRATAIHASKSPARTRSNAIARHGVMDV
jgi:hypothetical protein